MNARRAGVVALPVFVLAALGAPVNAQFGNPLKRALPKPPAAAAPEKPKYCEKITDKSLDDLLKALDAERSRRQNARQQQEAAKKSQMTRDQAAADRMMAAMAKQEACEQAAMEKDPRFKEATRLGELRNKAQDRGDEAAADKYGEQLADLTDKLEQMARAACMDPACLARARAQSPLNETLAEFRAAVAKASGEARAAAEAQVAAYLGMIESEAIQKCGPVGAAAPTAAEQAASDAAAHDLQNATSGIEAGAAEEAGLSEKEYNRLVECSCGALRNRDGTPITEESKAAIVARRGDLTAALGRKCD